MVFPAFLPCSLPCFFIFSVCLLRSFRAYYGGTGIALRGHRHHQGWEFYTGKVLEYCLDKVMNYMTCNEKFFHTWLEF